MTDEQIVETFVKTSEYQTNTVAPANGSTTALINTYYQRLFGRLAAAVEVQGWTDALNSGAVNKDYLGITMMRAGLNLPAGTAMQNVLLAKFASAEAFSSKLSSDPTSANNYTTDAAIKTAQAYLDAVTTATAASASDLASTIDSLNGVTAVGTHTPLLPATILVQVLPKTTLSRQVQLLSNRHSTHLTVAQVMTS